MSQQRDRVGTAILASLTAGTAMVAAIMLHRGTTTPIEAVSFITGAISVWLTVRESAWNFPIGLANEIAFFIVCARERLYADAGLQVIWFALTGIGWYLWLFGGPGQSRLPVTFSPRRRLVNMSIATGVMSVVLYFVLRRVNDSAPMLDAVCTAVSLAAQWLLDRKHIENWIVWFVVDLVYIPLYLSRSLNLSAVLYAVFVVMCVIGWRAWLSTIHQRQQAQGSLKVETAFTHD